MAIEMNSNKSKDIFMNFYMERNVSPRAKLFPTVKEL